MRYCISRRWTNEDHDLSLTKEEFDRLQSSQAFLLNQLAIEQRYDLVVSNFVEFQRAIHREASEFAVRPKRNVENFDNATASINRTFLNFLSSSRAYLDQLRSSSSEIVSEEISNTIAKQYDERLAFRAMEALRNYSQHRGIPIHSLSFNGEWVDFDVPNKQRKIKTAVPALKPRELGSDGKFKRSVLNELLASGSEEIPLLPWVKEYLGSLSAVHRRVRELHEKEYKDVCSFRLLEAVRYGNHDGDTSVSDVYVLSFDPDGRIETESHLGGRLEQAIDRLRKTNRELVRFDIQHIMT